MSLNVHKISWNSLHVYVLVFIAVVSARCVFLHSGCVAINEKKINYNVFRRCSSSDISNKL